MFNSYHARYDNRLYRAVTAMLDKHPSARYKTALRAYMHVLDCAEFAAGVADHPDCNPDYARKLTRAWLTLPRLLAAFPPAAPAIVRFLCAMRGQPLRDKWFFLGESVTYTRYDQHGTCVEQVNGTVVRFTAQRVVIQSWERGNFRVVSPENLNRCDFEVKP